MGMCRFLANWRQPAANANGIGSGYIFPLTLEGAMATFMPSIDFMVGNSVEASLTGIGSRITKTTNNMRITFDAIRGASMDHASAGPWPTVIDRVKVIRVSDSAIILNADFQTTPPAMQSVSVEGPDAGGSTSRYLSINYESIIEIGAPGNEGLYIVELSGPFDRYRLHNPYLPWVAGQAYSSENVFIGMEDGQQPKIYQPIADANVTGATSLTAFIAANPAAFASNDELELVNYNPAYVKSINDFVDTSDQSGNWLGLKSVANSDHDFVLLRDEPEIYVDTQNAGGLGTGHSRDDALTTPAGLPDNTPVLMVAGSIVGGQVLSNDEIWIVQNGAIGGGGATKKVIIPRYYV